jgi:hypothetical protein
MTVVSATWRRGIDEERRNPPACHHFVRLGS